MTLEQNIFLAKRNLVDTIWKQANLEGVSVTFPETQMIIDGFSVANRSIEDLTIILNLKKAWQFLFDSINDEVNLSLIQDFNRIIGRDLVYKSGFLRTADVKIGGTNYKPKLPIEYEVKEHIETILQNENKKDASLELMLFLMRSQLFFDGNKRTAMLIANKILIENGFGILVVAQKDMNEFFTKIIHFYESNDTREVKSFCEKKCIETINFPSNNKLLTENINDTNPKQSTIFSKAREKLKKNKESLGNNRNKINQYDCEFLDYQNQNPYNEPKEENLPSKEINAKLDEAIKEQSARVSKPKPNYEEQEHNENLENLYNQNSNKKFNKRK